MRASLLTLRLTYSQEVSPDLRSSRSVYTNRPVLRSLTINRSNLSPPGDPTPPDAPTSQPLPTATGLPPPESRTAARSPTYYPFRPPRNFRRRVHAHPRPGRDRSDAPAARSDTRSNPSSWRRGRRRSWPPRRARRRDPRPHRVRQEQQAVRILRRTPPP